MFDYLLRGILLPLLVLKEEKDATWNLEYLQEQTLFLKKTKHYFLCNSLLLDKKISLENLNPMPNLYKRCLKLRGKSLEERRRGRPGSSPWHPSPLWHKNMSTFTGAGTMLAFGGQVKESHANLTRTNINAIHISLREYVS